MVGRLLMLVKLLMLTNNHCWMELPNTLLFESIRETGLSSLTRPSILKVLPAITTTFLTFSLLSLYRKNKIISKT